MRGHVPNNLKERNRRTISQVPLTIETLFVGCTQPGKAKKQQLYPNGEHRQYAHDPCRLLQSLRLLHSLRSKSNCTRCIVACNGELVNTLSIRAAGPGQIQANDMRGRC